MGMNSAPKPSPAIATLTDFVLFDPPLMAATLGASAEGCDAQYSNHPMIFYMPGRPAERHVALVIETSNAYARGILAGIRRFAAERPGWSLYLEEHSRFDTDHAWLEGWTGHGVPARIQSQETGDLVRRLGLPAVDLSASRLLPDLPCVETDDAQIATWAIEHFTE